MQRRTYARGIFTMLPLALLQLAFAADASPDSQGGKSIHTQDTELNRKIFDSIKPDPKPIVVYGEPPGSKIEFLRTGASTCGKYLYARVTVPAGSGPPPHVHHWTDEWFWVPHGGAVMFHGTRSYTDIDTPPDKAGKDTVTLTPVEPGELLYGPRHIIHGYTNATDKPIEVHIIWTPDTRDVSILGYFLSIYAPIFNDKSLNAQFNSLQPIKAVGEAKKYGMNFSHDFWQYIDDIKYAEHAHNSHSQELRQIVKAGDEKCGK